MVHLRFAATNSLCQRVGIRTPPAVFPQSREELLNLPQRTRFPIVAKASEPWLLPAGFKSVVMISFGRVSSRITRGLQKKRRVQH